MKITVHYSTRIGTIKKAFNKTFPFLKIEFIKTPAVNDDEIMEPDVLHNRYLGEIDGYLKQGSININGDHNASSVELLFKQNFGLPILVFRKQEKKWVHAEADELTLSQHNEMGKESNVLPRLHSVTGFIPASPKRVSA